MKQLTCDVAVIGGGPAGMAAACSAHKAGADVVLIEREERLGGVLKQCIHDGFGLVRFKKKMAGPEYAQYFIDLVNEQKIKVLLSSFVTDIKKDQSKITLTVAGESGLCDITANALVLATGCRERTARQVAIHGTRPAGVLTAGAAQHYTNLLGKLPGRRCVILGSGDIGLIMARRLTLEGAKVLGVYEAKPTPSGLMRNISQCLYDFDIPLYVSHTVTEVMGKERVEAVKICEVDEKMRPIAGTEETVECDSLILSVGLIPENELAEQLNVSIDHKTKGPICDQFYQTSQEGIFVCGNALHVNDLVDYVSESGEGAGAAAAAFTPGTDSALIPVEADEQILYCVPQRLSIGKPEKKATIFFRAAKDRDKTRLRVFVDDNEVFSKVYQSLRPPEMERIAVSFDKCTLTDKSRIMLRLEEVN